MSFLPLIAFRSLRKNKVKTLVTSVGILLSVILLTTVVILSSSFMTSMIASTIKKTGDWHIVIKHDSDYPQLNSFREKDIENFTKVNELGYSKIPDYKNQKFQ